LRRPRGLEDEREERAPLPTSLPTPPVPILLAGFGHQKASTGCKDGLIRLSTKVPFQWIGTFIILDESRVRVTVLKRILEFFSRPPGRTAAELADFIDAQAAFLAPKGIYEYSRARAGHYAKVLFAEAGFQHAVEQSRWRAFPLGLAMVAEIVEGILRPHAGDDRRSVVDAMSALVLSIFDRYPFPEQLAKPEWLDARRELAHRLDLIGAHGVKFAKDVPEPFAEQYISLMPIHEKLRGRDSQTIRNYLRVTACNIHEEFEKRADVPALAQALRAQAAAPR